MEMKQISDSTIKITMKLEDLQDHGMEIADFLVPQEKTEDFFYTILDELDMPDHFLDSGMLSFRVTPKPDRLDVFVTKSKIDQELDFDDFDSFPDMSELSKMSPEDFIKTLEKNIMEHSREDMEVIQQLADIEQEDESQETVISSDETEAHNDRYIYYILQFADLREVVDYAKTVNFEVDTSELYKMDGRYYLTILVDVEDQEPHYPTWLLARMREHADDTATPRTVLQEYGHVILVHDAVKNLQKVEY